MSTDTLSHGRPHLRLVPPLPPEPSAEDARRAFIANELPGLIGEIIEINADMRRVNEEMRALTNRHIGG